jgi:hypothetical protein
VVRVNIGRVVRPAAALLAGVAIALAAAGATAFVPGPRPGIAALLTWPTATAVVASIIVAGAAAVTRQWIVALPLAVCAAPLVVSGVGAAWIFTGAGVSLAWAGAVTAGVRSAWPAIVAKRSPRVQAGIAAVVAAFWLSGVSAAVADVALTGDAPHYLTIARSLIVDGDLDLRNDYDERRYRDFYAGSLEPRHTNASPWGEEFPFHGIGVAVLIAPAFAAFGVPGATATIVGLMAAGSALLWLAAWHLLRDAGAAWIGWATLVFSAPFGLHAAAVYPDGPAAAATAGALCLAALLHRGHRVPLATLAAGGAGLAALPWLHARLALVAGVLGAGLLWEIWRRQPERWTRAAWFLMLPCISLAGWIASALVMFDTWNPSAAILQRTAPGSLADIGRGLLGLLADHEYGLWPAAPAMAVAAWALPGFVRVFPLIGTTTGVAVSGVLVTSSAWVWWGGDAAPARFLTVVLPALALWAAKLWATSADGGRRLMLLGLAATATLTALYALVDGGARAYAFADGRGSIFAAFSPSVDLSLALPSLFRPGDTTTVSVQLALIWLAVGLAAAAVAARLPSERGEARASAIAACILMAGAGIAAEAGWRIRGATPWTPGTASLTLIREAAPRASAGIAPGRWGLRGVDEVVSSVELITPESVPIAPPLLLYVPTLPAGDYQLHTDASVAGGGQLRLDLGRDAWPFATWRAGDRPPPITLHAGVHSLRVTGDGAGSRWWLTPRRIAAVAPAGAARRVTRYGALSVYSMDDESYPETGGLWTGGRRATRLLIAAEPDVTAIDVVIGAGPTAVELAVSTPTRQQISLAAGEQRVLHLAVPVHGGPIDLGLDVRSGFPAAALGAASDSRLLGAWLAFRPAVR